jgi:DNA-binding HxlR family transcriptional regulator
VCGRYQRAAELVGRRWTAAVIRVTLDGPARFTEIRRSVPGLSARLLTERLRELEAEGLVERRAVPDAPGLAEYALTARGRALVDVVQALEAWVDAWGPGDR